MIIRYVHSEAPDEVRYFHMEKAWRNTPAFLGGIGGSTLEQFAYKELNRFNRDWENGFILSYQVVTEYDCYVTSRHLEQDYDAPDVICFTLPKPDEFDSISIIGAQLANAIDDAMDIIDQDEYDDFLEWCDAVFDMAAERMNGSWKYLEITKHIEV